ncbi:hypothetical protein SeMB42_g04940 [Synchytrium endobioticum]|uniref:Uncharacterized protein n=1 Tax=Synchytrium endobioticum TaxID=286115 RepID=A0A507CUQ9_9FUNG|nr:hypothetical protein SeLEV6574_g06014 [Synchytrium endobioticum]TPX42922.1 hypothetical protein SeMB42_g04940 [Synchytrium endobioticum]
MILLESVNHSSDSDGTSPKMDGIYTPAISNSALSTKTEETPLENHQTRNTIMDIRRLHDLQDENESLRLQLHKVVAQLANTEFTFAEKLDRMNLAHLMEIERLQTEHQADVADLKSTIFSLKEDLQKSRDDITKSAVSLHTYGAASPTDTSSLNRLPAAPATPNGTPIIARDWETRKLQMTNHREKERLSQELVSSMKRAMDLQNKIGQVEDELMLITTKYQDAVESADMLQKENEDLKQKVDELQQQNLSLSDDEDDRTFTNDSATHSPIMPSKSVSSVRNDNDSVHEFSGIRIGKPAKNHLDLLDLDDLGL